MIAYHKNNLKYTRGDISVQKNSIPRQVCVLELIQHINIELDSNLCSHLTLNSDNPSDLDDITSFYI